jgi:hypothetical protein
LALIPTTQRDVDARARRRFLFALSFLTLFAWLLREYFVLATAVDGPIVGDVRDYVAYAWNLVHHGVFSMTPPATALPPPDSFRGPGYPLFLAAAMALKPQADGWYLLALHAQALIGALTATATALLGRRWLAPGWALLAGLLMALWPHHIAATGALLSEVVFGAALVFALLCTARMHDSPGNRAWSIASGAWLGYAWLVNPLVLFLPFLFAVLAWRKGRRAAALWMLGIFLLPVALWSVRGAALHDGGGSDRAKVNLVQGSWPQYHRALSLARLRDDPIARRIMTAIDQEERLLKADTGAGLAAIASRLQEDPAYYGKWYLLQKPWLLWDWNIRIGAGGIYFLRTLHSPLETNPLLRVSTELLQRLNPLLFGLSLAAALVLTFGAIRQRPWAPPAAAMTAVLMLYVTAIHALLQAEPRYSTPYRPFEMLMAVSALATITGSFRKRFPGLARTRAPAADGSGMTRWRAAGLHLVISALVLSSAGIVAMVLWYPPSLFHVSGVDRLLLVLTAIDLSVGPLLTLLVYRHGKRGMRFDLTVIALLQAAFFAYGAHVFFAGRPVFLVGSVDRFELVFANQVQPADWAAASPPFDRPGIGRPRLVGLRLPRDPDVRSELVLDEALGHMAAHQPRLFREYAEVAPRLLQRAHPLDVLVNSQPGAGITLEQTLRSLGMTADAVRWLPLDSSRGSAVQLVDARDGRPLATVALDPWVALSR